MGWVVFIAYTIGVGAIGYWTGKLVRRGEIVAFIVVIAPLAVLGFSGLLYELGQDDDPRSEDFGGIGMVVAAAYSVGVLVVGIGLGRFARWRAHRARS